jgi:protein ImuB
MGVADADPDGDQGALERIADWCARWTPFTGLDAPDGVMLDITGCTHLFGGEAAFRQTVHDRLSAQGFAIKTAIASTPACAWGVARFSAGCILPNTGMRAALLPLPLAALKLSPATIDALLRVGLKRIADIIDLPRAPLTARFGPDLLTRLDQALGLAREAISPRLPIPPYVAERRFFEPVSREDDILATAQDLGDNLTKMLEERGEGARTIVCSLFRVDGHVVQLTAGTSRPLRHGAAMRALLAERIGGLASEIDAGFGFDLIRLSVPVSAPFADVQHGLDGNTSTDALAHLIDRLGARFGQTQVVRFTNVNTHIPERAVRPVPAWTAPIGSVQALPSARHAGAPPAPARPLRLFETPEPIDVIAAIPHGPPMRFRWRRVLHKIIRTEGPERIAAEWWRDPARPQPTRDYFRTEDEHGQRYWLFRAGLYEQETTSDTAPRWFIHGLFA